MANPLSPFPSIITTNHDIFLHILLFCDPTTLAFLFITLPPDLISLLLIAHPIFKSPSTIPSMLLTPFSIWPKWIAIHDQHPYDLHLILLQAIANGISGENMMHWVNATSERLRPNTSRYHPYNQQRRDGKLATWYNNNRHYKYDLFQQILKHSNVSAAITLLSISSNFTDLILLKNGASQLKYIADGINNPLTSKNATTLFQYILEKYFSRLSDTEIRTILPGYPIDCHHAIPIYSDVSWAWVYAKVPISTNKEDVFCTRSVIFNCWSQQKLKYPNLFSITLAVAIDFTFAKQVPTISPHSPCPYYEWLLSRSLAYSRLDVCPKETILCFYALTYKAITNHINKTSPADRASSLHQELNQTIIASAPSFLHPTFLQEYITSGLQPPVLEAAD